MPSCTSTPLFIGTLQLLVTLSLLTPLHLRSLAFTVISSRFMIRFHDRDAITQVYSEKGQVGTRVAEVQRGSTASLAGLHVRALSLVARRAQLVNPLLMITRRAPLAGGGRDTVDQRARRAPRVPFIRRRFPARPCRQAQHFRLSSKSSRIHGDVRTSSNRCKKESVYRVSSLSLSLSLSLSRRLPVPSSASESCLSLSSWATVHVQGESSERHLLSGTVGAQDFSASTIATRAITD